MIKVVTFNILCGGSGETAISERAPRVKTVLKRYDADLIGLQEAVPAWIEHLEADFGEEYEIFYHYRKKENLECTPMMWRKARFECLDKGFFWFSDTPAVESGGWDTMGCYRICMWAKLRDKQEGNTFVFINTHYGFGDDNQIKSGRMLMNYIKALKCPAIVTADFNMTPSMPGYRTLREQLIDTNSATVQDTRNTFHGFSSEPTGNLIDFCFFTPETISAITSKRMDDMVDGKFPSDHYGVYSELEVHEKLSLISYNVKNGGNEPEERATLMRRLLRGKHPDIFCLQEVTPLWEEAIARLEGYDYALQYRLEEQKEGTPVFWRKDKFDLVHKEHFWLSETPEQPGIGFGGKYARVATLVVLQWKNSRRKICILNTHFDFSDAHHVASAKLIAERLKPYAELPVIVTADFNMYIGGAGYRAMRESFRDLRMDVAPLCDTRTINGMGAEIAPAIIDYVFYNGVDMKPTDYRVIDSYRSNRYISDHNGIQAEFMID